MALRRLNSMRFNPLPLDKFPAGYESQGWKDRLRDANKQLSRAVLDMINEARDAGASAMAEPTTDMIELALEQFKAVLAGADIPEMTEETRFDLDPQADYAVIDDMLGLLTSQYLASDKPEVQAAAKKFIERVYDLLETRRKPVRAYIAEQNIPFAALAPAKKVVEVITPDDIEADLAEEFGEEVAAQVAGKKKRASAPKKSKKDEQAELLRREAELQEQLEAARRQEAMATRAIERGVTTASRDIGGYAAQMVQRRVRIPGEPSDALLSKAGEDILVFRVKDGTAQLWIKKSLTYTFKSTQGRSSVKTAALYANEWRKSGKKSRLKCRILLGEEGSNDFVVVAESLDEIAKQAPKKQTPFDTEVADLKRMNLKNNPGDNMKWVRYHYDRNEGYVLDPEGEMYSLTRPGFGTVEMYKIPASFHGPAFWKIDLFLDDDVADERLEREGRAKYAPSFVVAQRIANELLKTRSNPDWRRFFGLAKEKGAQGAAVAKSSALRAAHEAKILAAKARLGSERERYRSAYNTIDQTYALIMDAIERKDKRAEAEGWATLSEVLGLAPYGTWKPNRLFGLQYQKKQRSGFYGIRDEIEKLERTRPAISAKRNGSRRK